MADDERPPLTDEQREDPLVVQIAAVNDAMDEEIAKWQKLSMHPIAANDQMIVLYINDQLWSLVDYLEKVVPEFDGVAFELHWKQRLLGSLIETRKENEKRKTAQEITAGIVGADGRPIKFP